jgi:hypothetical protein
MIRSTSLMGPVAAFADQTFEPEFAGLAEKLGANLAAPRTG